MEVQGAISNGLLSWGSPKYILCGILAIHGAMSADASQEIFAALRARRESRTAELAAIGAVLAGVGRRHNVTPSASAGALWTSSRH